MPEEKRKSAIKGAFFSEYIDMLDIYLPVLFYFHPPNISEGAATIFASLVFITTLLGRPLGALLFDMVADKLGRRKASILLDLGIRRCDIFDRAAAGIRNAGAGFLFVIGVVALCRWYFFLGSGYTGAMPLAIEYAKKEKRSFVGGFIIAGFPPPMSVSTLLQY